MVIQKLSYENYNNIMTFHACSLLIYHLSRQCSGGGKVGRNPLTQRRKSGGGGGGQKGQTERGDRE